MRPPLPPKRLSLQLLTFPALGAVAVSVAQLPPVSFFLPLPVAVGLQAIAKFGIAPVIESRLGSAPKKRQSRISSLL